jgi:ABC-2 type transport system ATP-binding protein
MIEVYELTKKYGQTLAVDHLTFEVLPGRVTGFLGPNGAGKSTTMRAILALDAPDSGATFVDDRPYQSLRHPLGQVGALLDANAVHGGRSARDHLTALAVASKIPRRRVGEVLELTGIAGVADKRVRGYSLGMKQRLGIAGALLADPPNLMFDEPVNGLDPEGIRWMRTLMKSLAAEGRTVLVSSHLMSEMALTADHLIVIGRGQLIEDTSVEEFVRRHSASRVCVRSTDRVELAAALREHGATVEFEGADSLLILGATTAEVGDLATARGLTIHEMFVQRASLEDVFMELTSDAVEYQGSQQ